MNKYSIAGLVVGMTPKYETLLSQSEKYKIESEHKPDFLISLDDEFLMRKLSENPHLSISDCEYIWSGFDFYKNLISFDGMLLHSSCVAYRGEAYIFSAPSGTGKSTHTSLWKNRFGDELVFINDDKPAVRFIDGIAYACGTPFSGKTDTSENISAPIKGICMLERSETNSIARMGNKEAVIKLLEQTLRPKEPELMIATLDIVSRIVSTVPIYKLKCNISVEAVEVAYNGMNSTI